MNLFGQPKFDIGKLKKHIEKLKIDQEKAFSQSNFYDSSPTAWPTSFERKENKYGIHLNLKNATPASSESLEPVYIEYKPEALIYTKDPIKYKNLKPQYHPKPLRMSTVSLNASTNFRKESIIKVESVTPKCFQRSILSKNSAYPISSSPSCISQIEEDLMYNSNLRSSSPNSSKVSWKSFSFHRKSNSFGGDRVRSLSKGGGFMAAGPLINIKIPPHQLSSPHNSIHSEDIQKISRSVKNPIFPSYKLQPSEDIIEHNYNRIKRRRL